ncbi:conserved hypothetical protein [delta proteobacterium NaphS2]|nr:conserved hypothetical protein [delta proteobacterium NaphS2]
MQFLKKMLHTPQAGIPLQEKELLKGIKGMKHEKTLATGAS